MALQLTGPITMADIVGEFGGTAPHALSEYYGVDSGVPNSGTINYSNFYGASAVIPLEILGTQNFAWSSGSTAVSSTCSVPAGTQSVIMLSGIGTNGSRRSTISSVSGFSEVRSQNDALSEYSFDSAIHARNASTNFGFTISLTNTCTTYYGMTAKAIYLSRPFNSFAASATAGGTSTGTITLNCNVYAGGVTVGAATVRGNQTITMGGFTSYMGSYGVGDRDQAYGWMVNPTDIFPKTVNCNGMFRDFGETFCVASFAPSKFS